MRKILSTVIRARGKPCANPPTLPNPPKCLITLGVFSGGFGRVGRVCCRHWCRGANRTPLARAATPSPGAAAPSQIAFRRRRRGPRIGISVARRRSSFPASATCWRLVLSHHNQAWIIAGSNVPSKPGQGPAKPAGGFGGLWRVDSEPDTGFTVLIYIDFSCSSGGLAGFVPIFRVRESVMMVIRAHGKHGGNPPTRQTRHDH